MALYYHPVREAEAESSTFRGRGTSRVGAEESIEHTARIICGHRTSVSRTVILAAALLR
jgi:hypothetical protein